MYCFSLHKDVVTPTRPGWILEYVVLVAVCGEKCFLGEKRVSILFTSNSLTGLKEEKAMYGRLGSIPRSQKKVCFSQEREETLGEQFE